MALAIRRWTSVFVAAACGFGLPGRARAETPSTCSSVTRETIVACALRASAAVRAGREEVSAASGRRTAAAPWFPANPTLSLSLARRGGTEGRADALNVAAALSQEIDIAGARAARRREAEADVAARVEDVVALSRRAAAEAYVAYFDLLAARDALDVTRRLEAVAAQIARITRGRADAGVASALDAEIADAASLRVVQARLAAERELRSASANLAARLGRDPTGDSVSASGVLEPLAGSDALAPAAAPEIVRQRPEIRALASEQRALEERAAAFRRARVPSVTVQVFAQNDGYNERVLGGGLSVPIPLPQPVGRLYTGEIAEAEALARRTRALSDGLVRELTADLATAAATYDSRRAENELFTKERVDRSEQFLAELGKEIETGRLSVRDALLAQQQLIEVLRGRVEVRRALCVASVELALASGVPLEGQSR